METLPCPKGLKRVHIYGPVFLSPPLHLKKAGFFDGRLACVFSLVRQARGVRLGLCTLTHLKCMKTHGVFDMLFVKIRTKTHLVFFKDGRHKLGFMHINAPQLSMFPFTTTGVFMV